MVLFSKPIIDIIIKWTPEPKKPVDFVNVGDIIELVIEKFPHTCGFRFDHFESEKIIQEIQAKGIKADAVFFSNRQQMRIYRILRHLIWRNEIEIMWDDLAIHELEDLILVNRYKLEHPSGGGSKDVSDAIANCVAQISEFSYKSSMFSDSGEGFDKEMKELRQWLLWFRRKHKRDPNMVEVATHFRVNPVVAEDMLANIQHEIDVGLFMGVESEMMDGVPMGDVDGSGSDLGLI
ncbi:unnamed protein product [marine sediment metagenome]|uniref:Uncharacterized protein n=1 Tax=marine sediment metagenome TaxID=412755 RepID=X0W1P5_9ZZZZ